ncbi:amino acid ABC transporter substrate-binding protein [Chromobacterium paludis]|uniref:Amino acid ABC transporter substrate-binding protein n=2 Tax=Chromobacterium paludis TaxID=2605945 RepID=A0A5C1DCS1_9NEIS|nr:amino acid ABC transporter substrate-binding protein [Chromobacterium paludis]
MAYPSSLQAGIPPESARMAVLKLAASSLGLLLACAMPQAQAQLPATIKICVDVEEWPPFFYYQRQNGQATARNIGYTVDYLQAIFGAARQNYSITRKSWVRCLADAKSGLFDMTLDGVNTPEREQAYWISKPYYYTTGIYFFARARPQPRVNAMGDLKKLRICGQRGYAYKRFGVEPSEVDTTAYTLAAAMAQLKAGHCDVVPEEKEVAIGMAKIGMTNYLDHPDFDYREVPGMPVSHYHMFVSRKLPYAQELLKLLDSGINEETSARLRKQDLDPVLTP